MSRLHGSGFRWRLGISLWGCACLKHQHPMLQLGSRRVVLRYPRCVGVRSV